MPHATNGEGNDSRQGQNDDDLIAQLLNNETSGQANEGLDFMARDLEIGEKADDALDFEDISDDDLASEEESAPVRGQSEGLNDGQNRDNLEGDADDDLFGDEDNAFVFGEDEEMPKPPDAVTSDSDGQTARPRIALPGAVSTRLLERDGPLVESPASSGESNHDHDLEKSAAVPSTTELAVKEESPEEDDAIAIQRALFARAGRRASQEPPDAPETDMELFFSIWPSYNTEGSARFTELFPPPPGTFNWKSSAKPPKPLVISKITLDIAPDTERSFRIATVAPNGKSLQKSEFDQPNIVRATRPRDTSNSSEDELDMDEINDQEVIGGVIWKDIELACCDWDSFSVASGTSMRDKSPHADSAVSMDVDGERPAKRLRMDAAIAPLIMSLDDPEQTTQKLAKRIALDAHDPDLLIDESLPRVTSKKRTLAAIRAEAKDTLSKDLTRRYNISNDDAYELLKENHQHKVRSTLGNVLIEHSLPAVKLQYPFYKVKLDPRQLRSFHRPQFSGARVGKEYRLSKPKVIKKKHLRGREPKDIFAKAEDLSMGDNSSGLLLEYAEELPMMLSNFGMGNKIVNFYRRRDEQDSARPKEEIGETQVLLPQDRSPFANFGHVDPGETVPSVQNFMYRAPIFRHEAKHTDFLVACNMTAGHEKFYLRKMENLHVVGQQFPSTEIPGEHSRKVTDAAKKRLKAISYRVWRKWSQRRGQPLTNAVVQQHLPGSDIAQNRGKMREFMKYDKNNSIWIPKDSDVPPESDELRTMIKPEDICLLDSMQVGVQHLNDLGLRRDDELNDDDDDKEGTNIELLLAPWSATKNFMNATQGKAMLKLHGEGDPTGRGEGFSFIKTSMKGGFRALGESIQERLDAKNQRDNHGHSYNVAKQQRAYDESIRRIWRAQKDSLSSKAEHSDLEMDIDDEPEDMQDRATTPRTGYGTPAFSRREDETVSQFSRNSMNRKSQTLVITRMQRDRFGGLEEVPHTITDPRVIQAYRKAKVRETSLKIDPNNLQPTGDAEFDAMQIKAAAAEMVRIQKSMKRAEDRRRAKGIIDSPSAVASPGGEDGDEPGTPHPIGTGKRGGRKKVNPEGTGRRCANCGQIGHIKTNKKLCPMLNGTMRPEDIHTGFGGGTGIPAPAGAPSASDTPAPQDEDEDEDMRLPGMEI